MHTRKGYDIVTCMCVCVCVIIIIIIIIIIKLQPFNHSFSLTTTMIFTMESFTIENLCTLQITINFFPINKDVIYFVSLLNDQTKFKLT